MKNQFAILISVTIFALIGSLFLWQTAVAWSEPSQAPPSGNVSAPLNVGTGKQVKSGGLGLLNSDPGSDYGLAVGDGTIGSIKTSNAGNSAEVNLNRKDDGVYVKATKQSYSGFYASVSGKESKAANLTNSDLAGYGLYSISTGVGGLVVGDEAGLVVDSNKKALDVTSDSVAIDSRLYNKSAKNVSQTKLNFFNAQSKPVALGAYSYNEATGLANSYVELGHEKIGLKAAGDTYAGMFVGNVDISNKLTVGKGCSGCKDLAESVAIAEKVEAGEIVAVDNNLKLRKATKNDRTVVGIVSTSPAMTIGDVDVDGAAMALAGIVPVKVNAENGSIVAGDFITASSAPGEGMKAVCPGTVVGKALEPLRAGRGNIKVFVDLGWFNGSACEK